MKTETKTKSGPPMVLCVACLTRICICKGRFGLVEAQKEWYGK